MDNLRAATGWALDAAAVDDVALGVAILAGLAGEAVYRPSSGIQAWASAGVGRADELDAAQRPVLLGLAACDAFLTGPVRAGRGPRRPGHRRIGHLHPGAVRRPSRGQFLGLGRRGPGRGDGRPGRRPRRLERHRGERLAVVCLPGRQPGSPYRGDDDTASAEAEQAVAGPTVGSPTLLAPPLTLTPARCAMRTPTRPSPPPRRVVRLTEAGAGDTSYSPALQTGAMIRAGRRRPSAGAARAIRTAIGHEAGPATASSLPSTSPSPSLVLADQPATFEAAATLAGAVSGPVLGIFPPSSAHTTGTATNNPRRRGRRPRRRRATPTPNNRGRR